MLYCILNVVVLLRARRKRNVDPHVGSIELTSEVLKSTENSVLLQLSSEPLDLLFGVSDDGIVA